MSRSSPWRPTRCLAALCAASVLMLPGFASAADALSPEVGKPLQAAQSAMKAQKFTEALNLVAQTDAIANKTPYEVDTIARMRGAAALGAGQPDLAAKSFAPVMSSSSAAQRQQIEQGIAVSYYRAKQYDQAAAWGEKYQKDGGTNTEITGLIAQADYLAGKYPEAARVLQSAGKLDQTQMELLVSAYSQSKDDAGTIAALKQLVAAYPSKDYWAELIGRVQASPGFAERLSLDVYRLQRATGTLSDASAYMEYAQLALLAGYPIEARQVVDAAYKAGVFGTGADATRQDRLRTMVAKKAADDEKAQAGDAQAAASAKTGDVAVNIGYNFVVAGQVDKGIDLIQSGLSKGGVKHLADAQLQLGIAYLTAGKKPQAIQAFKSVQSPDGGTALAQLWALYAKQG